MVILVRMLTNSMSCIFSGTLRLSLESFEYWEYKQSEVGIPLTEKIYIFICIGLINIYILFMKPNQPYDEMYML